MSSAQQSKSLTAFLQAYDHATAELVSVLWGKEEVPAFAAGTAALYYTHEAANGAEKVSVDAKSHKAARIPLTDEGAAALFEAGVAAPNVQGDVKAVREIMPTAFALNVDLIHNTGIVEHIPSSWPLGRSSSRLAGSRFTPKERVSSWTNNHVGTLFLCLPSPLRTGNLSIITGSGKKIIGFWGVPKNKNSISWAFIRTGLGYEVNQGAFGIQVLLIYEVYAGALAEPRLQPTPRVAHLVEAIETMLHDKDLIKGLGEKNLLGIGLRYTYPYAIAEDGSEKAEISPDQLKDSDQSLLAAVRHSGASWIFSEVCFQEGGRKGDGPFLRRGVTVPESEAATLQGYSPASLPPGRDHEDAFWLVEPCGWTEDLTWEEHLEKRVGRSAGHFVLAIMIDVKAGTGAAREQDGVHHG